MCSYSVWSWFVHLSLTGVPSWWSTVENVTRTWSTLWEPTLWGSNCPPRTSSLAPTSSRQPGRTIATASVTKEAICQPLLHLLYSLLSPFPVGLSLSLQSLFVFFFLWHFPLHHFLCAPWEDWPSGVYSSTSALFNGLSLPLINDHWLLQNPFQGYLFQQKKCVIKWHGSDCTCNIRLTIAAPYGVVRLCVFVCVCVHHIVSRDNESSWWK